MSVQVRRRNTPIVKSPTLAINKPRILACETTKIAILRKEGEIIIKGKIPAPIRNNGLSINQIVTYNTTEKELLAVVWAVKHFRPYVYGTKFKIMTDHKPLIWLFSINDPGSRLIRWTLKLEEYDYEIIHKFGRANANPDALSRNAIRDEADTKGGQAICAIEKDASSEDTQTYTEKVKKQIIYEYHAALIGGHQGVKRTIKRICLTHN